MREKRLKPMITDLEIIELPYKPMKEYFENRKLKNLDSLKSPQ